MSVLNNISSDSHLSCLRTEEQKSALRNCGFVSYMRRHDAERALESLNGLILHDYEMKIGWGRSVPLPLLPIYPPAGNMALVSSLPTQMTRVRTRPEPPQGVMSAPGGYSSANTTGTPLPLDATIARSHAGGGGIAVVAAALGYGGYGVMGGRMGGRMHEEDEDPEALIHKGQGPDIEVKVRGWLEGLVRGPGPHI